MKTQTNSWAGLSHRQITAKGLFTLTFVILLSFTSFAQQLLNWPLPDNQLSFIGTIPSLSPLPQPSGGYFGQAAVTSMNGMHDASGNLLFHIVDGVIYDGAGYEIDQLRKSGTNIIGFEEMPIVPVPGSCTKFYIVTGVNEDLSSGPGTRPYPIYSIIDMSLQNLNYPTDPTKKGALQYFSGAFPSGTNIFDLSTIAPVGAFPVYALHDNRNLALAVTPLRSPSNDYFLFAKGKDQIFRFVINGSGITYGIGSNPFMVPSGPGFQNNSFATEMEVVRMPAGNYRLAYVYADIYIPYPEIDYNTGALVSNNFITMAHSTSQTPRAVGLEFSPNARYLYWTHTSASISTYNNAIHYADVTAGATPIPLATASYPGSSLSQTAFIEFAHNGKMYFNNGSYLSSLAFTGTSYIPTPANWTNVAVSAATNNFLLPDQLDGNFYSGGSAGTIVSSYTAGTFPYTATTQTWTPTSNPFGGTITSPVGTVANPVVILNSLVIPAGYNITISGMRFEFAGRTYDYSVIPVAPLSPGAFVQVLRSNTSVAGGRLTLTNTTFTSTNTCKTGMWEGIEVQGQNTVSQGGTTTGKQAWLTVKNSSIVENAYHAVVLARITNTYNGITGYSTTPSIDLSYSGGTVQVTTLSRFRNNYIDVYFGNYDPTPSSIDNNNSSFDNCTFETTALLLDPNLDIVNWFHHIMIGVKGITYAGVTFQNAATSFFTFYDILNKKRGSGIFSFNSHFIVTQRFAPPFGRGKFNNLTYGIYAADFGSTQTFTVQQSDFNDNYRGIYSGSVNYQTIIQNTFAVNRWPMSPPTPTPSDAAYGVYLDFCKGFKVMENDFKYAGATTPMANSFGVIVNQSNIKRVCGQHDEIYKNTFHNILAGGRAQGNNSEQDVDPITNINSCYGVAKKNYIGLEFLCNNFSSNVDNSDLSVTRSQNLATQGNIAYLQGDFSFTTNTPAGNVFSHTASAFDFYSQSFPTDVNGTIVYVSHSDPSTIPTTFVNPPVSPYVCTGCGIYTTAASCPSKISILHSTTIARFEIKQAQNKAAFLESQIDGGNTTALLAQVYSSMPDAALRNLLLSNSPFLSDRVLSAYITKSGVPPLNIRQVVLANSPVTQPVMNDINSIGLPTPILNSIIAAQIGISTRTKLESDIAFSNSKRAYNIDELVRIFSNDSTYDHGVDSILTVFKTYNLQQNGTDITLAYLTKGDIPKATYLNDSIKGTGTDTTFTKMMDVAISLKQSSAQESNLLSDLALKTKVDDLAALTDAKESPSANAVLKLLFNYVYHEYIEPASWDMPTRSMLSVMQEDEPEASLANMYPNPSNGESNFSYTLEEGETGVLQLFDITGKLIHSYELPADNSVIKINNTELEAGTYLYKYIVNGSVSKADKLVIIK